MELFSVGIEYEGQVALFSTMDKAKAYVAKQDKKDLADALEFGYIKTADKYRSAWYISPVIVDAEC